jgi:hypothetical protein
MHSNISVFKTRGTLQLTFTVIFHWSEIWMQDLCIQLGGLYYIQTWFALIFMNMFISSKILDTWTFDHKPFEEDSSQCRIQKRRSLVIHSFSTFLKLDFQVIDAKPSLVLPEYTPMIIGEFSRLIRVEVCMCLLTREFDLSYTCWDVGLGGWINRLQTLWRHNQSH